LKEEKKLIGPPPGPVKPSLNNTGDNPVKIRNSGGQGNPPNQKGEKGTPPEKPGRSTNPKGPRAPPGKPIPGKVFPKTPARGAWGKPPRRAGQHTARYCRPDQKAFNPAFREPYCKERINPRIPSCPG